MTKIEHRILLDVPIKMESERLILGRYEEGDGKDLYTLLERNNNRVFLKEHADEATNVMSRDDAENRVRTLSAWWDTRDRFVMGIWLKETNEYIGNIWIEPKDWNVPSFEIGFFLDRGFTGKGYAYEAAKRSLRFIIENLDAHKIILITRDTNERAIKLAQRLGFINEGHHVESNIENGKRYGLLYYRMLRKEYNETIKHES